MKTRIDGATLREMGRLLDREDRDEMAIPSYLHRNPALRWMAWRRLEVVAGMLARACPPGGTVMDYGCGTGVLFADAAAVAGRVIGVDPVLDAARLWRERRGLDRVELLTPDDAMARVAPGSVDIVVAAEVLEHIEPPDDTLAFFARALAPRGRLLVSLPTENRAYRLGRRLAGFDGHYHAHDARLLDAAIRRTGFVRERLRHVPLPGPLAIYWIAAYRLGDTAR